jgi:hypothetical protein
MQNNLKAMAVHVAAFMPNRNVRQPMGRLKAITPPGIPRLRRPKDNAFVRSTCQVNRRGAEIFKLTAEPGCKSRVTGALNNSVQIFIAKGLGRVMKALCNRIKLTPSKL